jgi:hypothetical protein
VLKTPCGFVSSSVLLGMLLATGKMMVLKSIQIIIVTIFLFNSVPPISVKVVYNFKC